MCGITGWIDWNHDLTQKRNVLEEMTATLANRGPDAKGLWLSCHAALGHRRLSVVDPEGGAQPMIKERDGNTYVVIYNGELYNFVDLRNVLKSKGYHFQSNSDTEVLLVAYMEWGPQCVEYFNGIFAFGIWDDKNQTLFMARDRLGVKPLFYAETSDGIVFGSEIKSILENDRIKAEVDEAGLSEIFIMGPSRTPGHGVFKGIYEVRPGFCLLYDRSGAHLRRYWQFESKPHMDDMENTEKTIRELLIDAVERQLVADVPVCTFLSGGIDSSAISAIASEAYKRNGTGQLHTYSIDYTDNDRYFKANEFQPNSDGPWVKKVSEYLGTHHHYIYVDTQQLVDALDASLYVRDLPGMADIDSSLYLFCKEIKKDATVALSGECADEMFGGYPWFHDTEALKNNSFPWVRNFEERMKLLSPELYQRIQPKDYLDARYQETLKEVPHLPGEKPEDAARRTLFYMNMIWFMTTLLDRKDRMSMGTGLEVRVPFCDHRLMEYVWNIPWEMKNCDDREKGILRRALKGILPEDVIMRKKSPYPKTHNPSYLAAVRERLTTIIENPNSPLLQFVNKDKLNQLLSARDIGFNKPWFGQLMNGPQLFAYLIQVNTWFEKYKVSIK
ncbi:asparagine synthase (glutamine-hydrolyzing) [Anaerosolibacter carboniphilus]|uniref:asparagine synthase (glutamine-hydrolyzing) n=1 Tax=Anaerosolibacter carboniphilus TaxID=1417629 RepID=A0A841KWD0_9FIRM|nr:asparagine synthase (glutamine-hydrolyzing) [Anaerosolibacter carboniphilus]MBB6217751.1 asparagine synthase (glutamine-hydrolyzing) [Anaerosolibacter carboniphilus]